MQGALNWLEENQDKSLEEIQAEEAKPGPAITIGQGAESSGAGQQAKSLVCNECGKRFRNHDQATFHAAKTYVQRSLTMACSKLTIPVSTPTSPSRLRRSLL